MNVTNTDHTAIWLSHEISDEPFILKIHIQDLFFLLFAIF